MDRKKLIYSILKEIEKGNYPKNTDYDITRDQFGDIVDLIIQKNFIENAQVIRGGIGHKVQGVLLKNSRITLDGIEHLEENSLLAKTYKGLKEIREWIKL